MIDLKPNHLKTKDMDIKFDKKCVNVEYDDVKKGSGILEIAKGFAI